MPRSPPALSPRITTLGACRTSGGPRHAEVLQRPAPRRCPTASSALARGCLARRTARGVGRVAQPARYVTPRPRRAFGTPAYVLDEADVRSRCRRGARPSRGAEVAYAGKAFLAGDGPLGGGGGTGLDVCSGGELAVARCRRIPRRADPVARQREVRGARGGLGRWSRVGSWSTPWTRSSGWRPDAAAAPQQVLVRITPGVDAHTHAAIATAPRTRSSVSRWRTAPPRRRSAGSWPSPALELAVCTATSARRSSTPRLSRWRSPDPRPAGPRSATSTASSCPSSTSAAAWASPMSPGMIREPRRLADGFGPSSIARPWDTVWRAPADVGARSGHHRPAGPHVVRSRHGQSDRAGRGLRRTYVSVDGGMSDNTRTALYDAEYTCVGGNTNG